MGLTVDLNAVFSAVLTKQNDLSSIGRTPLDFSYDRYLTDPTVDTLWWDTRTLALSSAEDLDVTSGLTDVYGVPINLSSLYALAVVASNDNVASLKLGNSANNVGVLDGSSSVLIPPGSGVFLSAPIAGWAVTPTDSIIRVENLSASAAATYSIMFVGKAA